MNAKVVVHNFSLAKLQAVVKPGMNVAKKTHQSGVNALDELQLRRKGLAASLLAILLGVVAINLKVREIESRGR